MKLQELFEEFEKRGSVDPKTMDLNTIAGPYLKTFEKELYQCEEFKNVLRINFLEMPSFIADIETGEPIIFNSNYMGEGDVKNQSVLSYKYDSDEPINFNKIVDIYSITMLKMYDTKSTFNKPGVWSFPTVYNPENSEPSKEIRVIWSPEKMQDAIVLTNSKESVKMRLMRLFEEALDRDQPNIPFTPKYMIRCSSRSVANKFAETEPAPTNLPSWVGFSDTLE